MCKRYLLLTAALFIVSFFAGYLGMEVYSFHQLLEVK